MGPLVGHCSCAVCQLQLAIIGTWHRTNHFSPFHVLSHYFLTGFVNFVCAVRILNGHRVQCSLASTVHKPDDWLLQCLQNGSLRLHSIGSDSRTFIGRDYYPHLGKTLSDQDPLLGGLIFFPGLEFGGFSFFPFASLCWYGS